MTKVNKLILLGLTPPIKSFCVMWLSMNLLFFIDSQVLGPRLKDKLLTEPIHLSPTYQG